MYAQDYAYPIVRAQQEMKRVYEMCIRGEYEEADRGIEEVMRRLVEVRVVINGKD